MTLFTQPCFVLLFLGVWWVFYFIRLGCVARHGRLKDGPRLYLWLSLYGMGL